MNTRTCIKLLFLMVCLPASQGWSDDVSEPILQTPEMLYNRSVELYQQGELDEAQSLLQQSLQHTDNPQVAARARYNLGNIAYTRALQQLETLESQQATPTNGQMDAEQVMDEAIANLEVAVSHYRAALRTDPLDNDARVNIELARQLIDALEEQKQQQQEQEQQEQEQEQNQEQERNQEQEQEQDSQGQEGQGQSPQDQQQASQDASQEQEESAKQEASHEAGDDPNPSQRSDAQDADPSETQQGQDEMQQADRGDQQQADEGSPDPMEGESHAQDQAAQEEQQAEANPQHAQEAQLQAMNEQEAGEDQGQGQAMSLAEIDELTDEEASQLLQAVRDRHLQRRIDQVQRQQSRYEPVEQDW